MVAKVLELRPGEAYTASMHPTRRDGWLNTATGIGTERDKAIYHQFAPGAYLSDWQLDTLFHEDDFAHRGVAAIVKEAFKLPFVPLVRADSAAPTENAPGEGLDVAAEVAEAIDQWKLHAKWFEAAVWGRLHGGGLLYFDCDDGRYPYEPLNESRIRSLDGIHCYDRRSFSVRSRYRAPHPKAGEPETYWHHPITGVQGAPSVIHESRLVVFRGALTSPSKYWQNGGWDDSVIVRGYAALVSSSANWQSICHLMHDFSQGVFGIKDLVELIRSGQQEIVQARLEFLEQNRASNRAIAIDKDHESFERRSSEMGGAEGLADKSWLRLAAAWEMPVTILMGQSPTGFDATGTSDQTVWYDSAGQYQQQRVRDPVQRSLVILVAAQNGPTNGRRPKRLGVGFASLWTGSPKDRAAEQEATAKRDVLYVNAGILTPYEVALARFTDRGWSAETQIDRGLRHQCQEIAKQRMLLEAANPPAKPGAPGERPQSPQVGGSEPAAESTPDRTATP